MSTTEERASEIGIQCRDGYHRRRVDTPWACQACVAKAILEERKIWTDMILAANTRAETLNEKGEELMWLVTEVVART